MKSFKQYITEVEHKFKSWKWVSEIFIHENGNNFYVPLSPKLINRRIGRRQITALHVAGKQNIRNLINLQGSSKSVSAFSSVNQINHKQVSDFLKQGIWGGGGFVFELEGNLLMMWNSDANSVVDEQGRRWVYVKPDTPQAHKEMTVVSDKLKDAMWDKIVAIYNSRREDMIKPDSGVSHFGWPKVKSRHNEEDARVIGQRFVDWAITKKEKGMLIKAYYDEIDKLLTKYPGELFRGMFHSDPSVKGDFYVHNEVIVSNFNIKKVYTSKARLNKEVQGLTERGKTLKDYFDEQGIEYEVFTSKRMKPIDDALKRSSDSINRV